MMGLKYIALYLLIAVGYSLHAQQEIVKVSKLKQLTYKENIKKVSIQGEKATIKVEAWDESYISVSIKSVSRNVDKKEAIADLEYIKYQTNINGTSLGLSNSFKGLSKNITSNLSIEYLIKIPTHVALAINNLYGPVNVDGVSNVEVNVSFGRIQLSNILKYAKIENRYSDVKIIGLKGNLHIDSDKSDLLLEKTAAETIIYSEYGSIQVNGFLEGNNLKINANKSSINVELQSPSAFNFNLTAVQGSITSPFSTIKEESFIKEINTNISWISISTSYNSINIQKYNFK